MNAEVIDLSAVGMRVRVGPAPAPDAVLAGLIEFDAAQRVEVKVRVVWCSPDGDGHLAGLEIVEAGKDFYDALPFTSAP